MRGFLPRIWRCSAWFAVGMLRHLVRHFIAGIEHVTCACNRIPDHDERPWGTTCRQGTDSSHRDFSADPALCVTEEVGLHGARDSRAVRERLLGLGCRSGAAWCAGHHLAIHLANPEKLHAFPERPWTKSGTTHRS